MPAGSDFATDLAALIFTATSMTGVADNAASSPITDIEVSLHTATPNSGNQTTSEATYTSYARVPVPRAVSVFLGGSGAVSNDSAITFPTSTGGTNTITHVALGTAHTGSGKVIFSGALNVAASVTSGVQPKFAIAALSVTIS